MERGQAGLRLRVQRAAERADRSGGVARLELRQPVEKVRRRIERVGGEKSRRARDHLAGLAGASGFGDTLGIVSRRPCADPAERAAESTLPRRCVRRERRDCCRE